jgi:hypothetical protein
MMWSQLADSDGQAVSLNATHLVMTKEHGDRARVAHACCEVTVLQSHAAAIVKALRLQHIERAVPSSARHIELH